MLRSQQHLILTLHEVLLRGGLLSECLNEQLQLSWRQTKVCALCMQGVCHRRSNVPYPVRLASIWCNLVQSYDFMNRKQSTIR